jgi:farnesyl-diphosphate farnesyltransferase
MGEPGSGSDAAFCEAMLPRVSRSFAVGIAALPPHLREATTAGYLLCRIADAIEDETDAPILLRRRGLMSFAAEVVRAVHSGSDALLGVPPELLPPLPSLAETAFPAGLQGTSSADRELLERRASVLAYFSELPRDVRAAIGARVVEMAGGMAELLQAPRVHPLASFRDLERYCYFVAGTVGHMLTALFAAGAGLEKNRLATLTETGPAFGIGLQLVNVIKDAGTDLEEGRCFVPRSEWPDGFSPDVPPPPDRRDVLRPALSTLIVRAARFLDRAEDYLLALPPELVHARQFSGLALHLALSTLAACQRSPDLLSATHPVKVSREEVARVLAFLAENATDDDALKRRYEELRGQIALAIGPSRALCPGAWSLEPEFLASRSRGPP